MEEAAAEREGEESAGVLVVEEERSRGAGVAEVEGFDAGGMEGVGAGGAEGVAEGGVEEAGTGKGELTGIFVVEAGRSERADTAVVKGVSEYCSSRAENHIFVESCAQKNNQGTYHSV